MTKPKTLVQLARQMGVTKDQLLQDLKKTKKDAIKGILVAYPVALIGGTIFSAIITGTTHSSEAHPHPLLEMFNPNTPIGMINYGITFIIGTIIAIGSIVSAFGSKNEAKDLVALIEKANGLPEDQVDAYVHSLSYGNGEDEIIYTAPIGSKAPGNRLVENAKRTGENEIGFFFVPKTDTNIEKTAVPNRVGKVTITEHYHTVTSEFKIENQTYRLIAKFEDDGTDSARILAESIEDKGAIILATSEELKRGLSELTYVRTWPKIA